MRGDVRITRNPSTDQKNNRRRARQRTSAVEGQGMTTPTPADVTELRRQAAQAPHVAEQHRLMAAAEAAQDEINRSHQAARETDLGARIAADHLTPAPVHELNTSATDWLGAVASAGTDADHNAEMTVQADLWYARCHVAAKADDGEFSEQAHGMARHHAGAYGPNADHAETTFLRRVSALRQRDIDSGRITRTAAASAAEGNEGPPVDPGLPGSATSSERAQNIEVLEGNSPGHDVTPVNDPGLGETHDVATPQNGPGNPQQDVGKTAARSPYGGHMPVTAEVDREKYEQNKADAEKRKNNNGKRGPRPNSQKNPVDLEDPDGEIEDDGRDGDKPEWLQKKIKESSMAQIAPCPACKGRGKVAVRHEGVSGLPQLVQTVKNDDSGPEETEFPEAVAFPLVGWDPNNVNNAISETEQQLSQRDKLKGASRQAALTRLAALRGVQAMQRQQAQAARKRNPWAFLAGQDDSGWIGDMGATPPGPGEQDGGNPPGPNNIQTPDPVYGYGGDNGDQPNEQVGAAERNDRTNQPPNWQIGQPTQMDQATVNPAGNLGPDGSPAFPNAPKNKSASREQFLDADPELAKARRFMAQRVAMFDAGQL
jgi:hypothetical protein